jgi:hypothetical protein
MFKTGMFLPVIYYNYEYRDNDNAGPNRQDLASFIGDPEEESLDEES